MNKALLADGDEKKKGNNKRNNKFVYGTAAVLGCLFSLGLLIGGGFEKAGTVTYLWETPRQCVVSCFRFIAWAILFTLLLNAIYHISLNKKKGILIWGQDKKVIRFLFEEHAWAAPFVCMVAAWIPYVIFLFPGTISWDGMEALTSAFRYMEWTNHHPFFSSGLMRAAIEIGRALGNENIGFFLYTFCQLLLQSGLFAAVFCLMKKMKVPYIIRILTLVWFAFFSVWPTNGYAMNKDSMYYIVFLAFMLLTSFLLKTNEFQKGKALFYTVYFISMLSVCLFRNNGIYVLILSLPFVAVVGTRRRRKEIGCLILALLLFWGAYQKLLLPGLDISPGSSREMFSIPFQQTARYVKEHGNEVTGEEARAIAAILDYENLAQLYEPELSDNVKWTYNDNAVTEEKLSYFKVWFQQFLKHPVTYFDATLNNIYRYFDPTQEEFYKGVSGEYEISGPDFYYKYFSFQQNESFQEERKMLRGIAESVKRIPGVGMIYGTGLYTWILLAIFGAFVVKKKYHAMVLSVPLLVSLLVCIASPVNGCQRYMLPILVSLPVLVCWIFERDTEELY